VEKSEGLNKMIENIGEAFIDKILKNKKIINSGNQTNL
ncbi:hypothetical protein LCGC14_2873190, partial [marine sediment metagenome]